MSKEVVIALLSSCVAIVLSAIAVVSQYRIAKAARDAEAEKHAARYREPLVRAAADLQSRLYNILRLDFFGAFYIRGTKREKNYAVANTVFLFAQYFAWTEAVRLEMQYIDLKDDEKTRKLSELQGKIYSLIQTDKLGTILRVFAGEQRALGERMLAKTDNGLKCIGYGEFLNQSLFAEDVLFQYFVADVTQLADGIVNARSRMIALQNALIDLIDHLDPFYLRFPKDERQKVTQ